MGFVYCTMLSLNLEKHVIFHHCYKLAIITLTGMLLLVNISASADIVTDFDNGLSVNTVKNSLLLQQGADPSSPLPSLLPVRGEEEIAVGVVVAQDLIALPDFMLAALTN